MAQALRSAVSGGAASATYYDQVDNIPTMRAGGQPIILPAPTPQYNTAATAFQQPNTMPPVAGWENGGNQYPSYANYGQQPGAYGNYSTPAGPYAPQQRKRSPIWWVIGVLVALILITSGVFAAVQINKNNTGTGATATQVPTTQANTPAPTATTQPTATKQPTPSPTATKQPTPSPTATKQPAPTTVPAGQQIYAATTPDCNNSGGGTWASLGNAQITCPAQGTKISNTAQAAGLQGIFLTTIPNQGTYPADYEIKVQLQQNTTPTSDFGVSFRSQASTQNGTYSLLIHPDGTWGIYLLQQWA